MQGEGSGQGSGVLAASITLGELAEELGAALVGDPSLPIEGVAEPASAGPRQLAPADDAEVATASAAGALLVGRAIDGLDQPQLVCADPRRALGLALRHFQRPASLRPGVSDRAAVATTARVDPSASVGAFCWIGEGAVVEAGCEVAPFSYIGDGALLEEGARVGPHAHVGDGCRVGQGARLGPGAVVGHDGFGFWREDGAWMRIHSGGRVEIGAGAELGANSCVDRGTLGATRVGAGAKIDNLVQVGHNAAVGEGALLCAQVGVSGSVEVGDGCQLGGQAGIADHVRLGAGARVGAKSGVARDVDDGQTVSGYPAMEHRRWLRASALFARLEELASGLRKVREQIARIIDRGPPEGGRRRSGGQGGPSERDRDQDD